MDLLLAADELNDRLEPLRFAPPVTHVYNPLRYAASNYREYAERFGRGPKAAVFVGMNPGPYGMAQTGIPFGEVAAVRDWLGIRHPVEKPPQEHPKRPVEGLACPRSEVSGRRLWGAVRDHFGEPEAFFRRFFVANYCPLCFMESSGRNRTPDKLPVAERQALFEACDEHLRALVGCLRPRVVVGVGAFAQQRAEEALARMAVPVGRVMHPSPANPAANRDWAGAVQRQLRELLRCG